MKIKEWIYDGKYSLQRMERVLKRNYYDAVADDDYDDDVLCCWWRRWGVKVLPEVINCPKCWNCLRDMPAGVVSNIRGNKFCNNKKKK